VGPIVATACVAVVLFGTAVGLGAAQQPPDPAPVDERLERAQERLREARESERVLTGDVEAYGDQIRAVEARLAPLRTRSARLEEELAALRFRLGDLSRRLTDARERLAAAKEALARRQVLLARRIREIYVREEPGLIVVLLQSGSLSAAVESTELLQGIADRDAALARSVSVYADETRRSRDAIAKARREVAAAEARARDAAAEARAAKAELEEQRAGMATLLGERRALLAGVRGNREALELETRDLQARSARLAAKIQAAQSSPAASAPTSDTQAPPPSSSGFAWPVSGTLTSPFGPRWGRMHEGLDIAGSSGTPIRASTAGTVILAGWNGGYGNLVVVDHGGGLSTAYAHNSSISVSVGQSVAQGTVLAGMGTTGNSTGVHLHFEIRVNGAAVNPLGYL
jgi:murein DD-endopeptidase MepM/ murein hydrolase activator NlpD